VRNGRVWLMLFMACIIVTGTCLHGCGNGKKTEGSRPPIEVGAVTVSPKDVPVTLVFVGQT
jgi:hypothetical protein